MCVGGEGETTYLVKYCAFFCGEKIEGRLLEGGRLLQTVQYYESVLSDALSKEVIVILSS